MVYRVETGDKRYDADGRYDSFDVIAKTFDQAVRRAKKHIKLGGNSQEVLKSVVQTTVTIN